MADVQRLVRAGAQLGEGTLWRSETDTVLWVNIHAGEIHETSLDGTDRILLTHDEPVSSVQLDSSGDVYFTGRHGLFAVTGERVVDIATGDVRLNDSAVSPAGDLVVGSMGYPEPGPGDGSLFSVDATGTTILASDITISNGIGWSSDGSKMFYIDTPQQRIDVFDVDPDTGAYEARREWASIDPALGNPDGLCVDSQDGVWVALWGGGKVIRLENGRIDHTIALPTPFVTCPGFAGPELDQLVITTASEPFGAEVPVGAGDVYRCDPSISGLPSGRLGEWVRAGSRERGKKTD